jgi:hypothetical protein
MRYQSKLTLWGVPLVSIAIGPDIASGQARGVARGVVAIGDVALGIVASASTPLRHGGGDRLECVRY